jgi:hypothetical protein
MNPTVRLISTTLVIAATAVASLAGAIRFTSTWKSMDAGQVSFAGKKVAALVISNNDSLRVAGEESLARELTARFMQGVPTYRIAPKEELQKAETAKPWFEKANIEGVVVVRPVSIESRTDHSPSIWVTPAYNSLWGYYGYGWSTVIVGGAPRTETSVVVETTIYSVPRDALLWAAVTESTNARDLPSFIQELVKQSVKVLQEQGLAKTQPR